MGDLSLSARKEQSDMEDYTVGFFRLFILSVFEVGIIVLVEKSFVRSINTWIKSPLYPSITLKSSIYRE